MYRGDAKRDAADKVRGFLFQDYITIMCLLQDQVECVCSEFLEDIDVFWKDGTFEFIQVKYYAKSTPNMKDILTDLYYQYLRLQILHSNLKARPSLYIYTSGTPKKLTLKDMKQYIEVGNALPRAIKYMNTQDSADWLKREVYISDKKASQKSTLFKKMASESTLEDFISKYTLSEKEDISSYKKS